MGQSISEFGSDLMGANKDLNTLNLFQDICDKFEVSNMTYFGSNVPVAADAVQNGENIAYTTYSDPWVHRYIEQDYQSIDPVIVEGFRSILPINWMKLPREKRGVRRFFGEAKEFGIDPHGLSVPVRGVHGDSALLTVNVDVTDGDWDGYVRENIADITYFAHLVHSHVLSQFVPVEVSLTKRERDVLLWAARGKTVSETALILQLSPKTVTFYLTNAAAKLGAATKTQAVARSISLSLVNP